MTAPGASPPTLAPLYGCVVGHDGPTVAALAGDQVLLLADVAKEARRSFEPLLRADSLLPLLSAGRAVWEEVFAFVTTSLPVGEDPAPHVVPAQGLAVLAPFDVADYVDFYASRSHAENVSGIFRPGQPPLQPNWLRLPVGYHGRAGTVLPSGVPIRRPVGQRGLDGDQVDVGPSRKLDIEAEIGWVVGGAPSEFGQRVDTSSVQDRVFGAVVVNDWSARDIQRWETMPLGPFLGKSFATSMSRWVLPLHELQASRVDPPAREVPVAEYLRSDVSWGLDIVLTVAVNGHVISTPTFKDMYWTVDQMLAHMTVNGARVRPGDLFASGTVSGWEPDQFGSLLELTHDGDVPIDLGGDRRGYLEDGDSVVISAHARRPDGSTVALGDVEAAILPALAL